tara:strand:+ start:106 stop:288 length:183 start_codon:yes stop_codon:yes gene_type:complete
MKVGDLVRSLNDRTHKKLGYGFVVDHHRWPGTPATKVFWFRYKGKANPRWINTETLEKVE